MVISLLLDQIFHPFKDLKIYPSLGAPNFRVISEFIFKNFEFGAELRILESLRALITIEESKKKKPIDNYSVCFTQSPEYPTCPDCKVKMTVTLLQMEDHDGILAFGWGDAGTAHVTLCPGCDRPGLGWACC